MSKTLDKVDKRILYELSLNCRIADTRLAKMVGKSKESIRYRIKNMMKDQTIKGFSAYINASKFGYRGYKLYLKTRENPELKKKFIDHLTNRPDVFWIGVGDGAFNVGLTFFARNNEEFYNKENQLFSEFSDVVISKVTGSIVHAIGFGEKFLIDEQVSELEPSLVVGDVEGYRLDESEKRLLSLLLRNGRMRLVDLVKKTDTSMETVRSRKIKLEQKGVIERYRADIDFRSIGMEFYKVFLYLEGLTPQKQKKLYNLCRSDANVVNMVKVIAPWNIELEIMAENYSTYTKVINRISKEFSDILVNVESTVLSDDQLYPSKKTIFDLSD